MKTILKLWAKRPKETLVYLAGMAMMVVYAAINAWLLTLVANTVDDIANVWSHLPPIVGLCMANTVIGLIGEYLEHVATVNMYGMLSNEFQMKLCSVPYRTFTDMGCDQVTEIGGKMNDLVAGFQTMVRMVEIALQTCTTFVAIAIIDRTVVIPLVVIYAIAVVLLYACDKRLHKLSTESRRAMKERTKEQLESVNGFAEVRSCNTQQHHIGTVGMLNNRVLRLLYKKYTVGAAFNVIVESVDTVGLVCILIYAWQAITSGMITAATALSLVMYVWRLSAPLSRLVELIADLQKYAAVAPDFDKFMGLSEESDGSIELKSFTDSIELENMSFSYSTTDDVLQNINLTIKKGQKIGICGESGGGKSTLLKLIPLLYDDFKGSIKIDGIDTRELTRNSLRNKIGYVHQDIHIFDSSIYENIVYGSPNATMDEVIEACKKAAIYEFIQKLPDKFNTQVGPRGLRLSGGQKQRISLARVFLKNADIVLLDEATSALDNEAENIIQESLGMLEGKTVITVAHRLSTIKSSDMIVVIGHHNIVEKGTHEELLSKGGAYAALYNAKEDQV